MIRTSSSPGSSGSSSHDKNSFTSTEPSPLISSAILEASWKISSCHGMYECNIHAWIWILQRYKNDQTCLPFWFTHFWSLKGSQIWALWKVLSHWVDFKTLTSFTQWNSHPSLYRFNLRLERSLLHLWTSIFWKELAVGIYRLLFIRFIYNVQPCFVGPVPMQNKSRQLRTSSWPKSPRTLHPQKKSGGKTPWPVNLSVVRHFSTRNPPFHSGRQCSNMYISSMYISSQSIDTYENHRLAVHWLLQIVCKTCPIPFIPRPPSFCHHRLHHVGKTTWATLLRASRDCQVSAEWAGLPQPARKRSWQVTPGTVSSEIKTC